MPRGRGIRRLKHDRESFVVKNPLINLLRSRDDNARGRPHILVCLPFLTIGGAERLISQICKGLGEEQFQISVLTTQDAPHAHGSAEAWFSDATERIYMLPRFLRKHAWKQFVLHLIHHHNIDILWLAGSEYIYELLPAIKTVFPGLKVVDLLFNEAGHTASNRKFDYCIDITITENFSVHTWLRGHGEQEERIRVIPNGIDLNLFTPRPKPVSDIQAGKFTVGYFGRLSHEKAPDVFVQIASHFKDQSGIQFLLAGDGPMMDEVSKLAIARGLGDSFQILGFTDSREHLHRCDAVIAPSRLDGRPNSVMEALASGIPVIASNVGGMAELISHGHTGFLCPAGSVPQFVEKVILLSQDRSLSRRMGENARRHAERHFDIRTTIASFGKIFSELKNGVPRCVPALEKPTA